MNTENLTNEERLQLITDMIREAKSNVVKGGSFYFLLWGWVVMLANFTHYFAERFQLLNPPYAVWLITLPAIVFTIIYSVRQGRNAQVYTQLDKVTGYLWIAIFVGIVITLMYMPVLRFNHNPIILILSGIGTFVSGLLLRFRPLLFGGVAIWVGAIVAFNVSVSDQQLVASIAILVGYLIPGYLLKREEK